MGNQQNTDSRYLSNFGKSALVFLMGAFSTALLAQEVSGEREIDVSRPPSHLAKSTLIEFLRKRQLSSFPQTVSGFVTHMIHAGASPIRIYVPRGRSLQAPNTDEREPRIVVGSSTANKVPTLYPIGSEDHTQFAGTDYEGRLYAGFAERVQQGEIISWNPNPGQRQPGKFDLFKVSNITAGGKPVVYEVTNRGTCTRCHQNEGPIFSLPPWSETMTHDPADSSLRQPAPPFASDPAVYEKKGVLLTREATPVPLGHVTGLAADSSSLAGVRLQQANDVIHRLCGNDLLCRRYLLVAAIFSASQSSYIRKNHYLLNPNAPSDVLGIDFTNSPLNALRAFLDPTFLKPPLTYNPGLLNRYPPFLYGLAYLDGFQNMGNSLWPKDNFVGITELIADPTMVVAGLVTAQEGDPATRRNSAPFHRIPPDLALPYVYDVAFEALGLNYQDSLQFIAMPLADRMRPLQLVNGQIPVKLRPLLENWPPTREEILQFYGLPDLTEQIIPSASNSRLATNKPSADSQMALFSKYCISCHGTKADGSAIISGNPIIPFQNQQQLLAYNTRRNGIILSRLSPRRPENAMPPPENDGVPHPTPREVGEMVSFFSAVPSNQSRGLVFTNYLDVRVQNVHPQSNSYIVPSEAVSIVRESESTVCGGGIVPQRPSESPTAMKLGLGNDNRAYLALENFPHYFQGGLVQTLMHPLTSDAGRCHVLGVSRNGQLWRIGFNTSRGFGSVPLKRDGDTNILFSHIAAYDSFLLGAGRDGKLYQIVYTDRAFTKYRANVVSITGVQNTERWFKTGFKMYGQTMKAIGETIEGRRMAFTLPSDLNNNGLTLAWDSAEGVSAGDFAANLLDKNSLLLNAN